MIERGIPIMIGEVVDADGNNIEVTSVTIPSQSKLV
jgi:hypothetical protein